METRTYDMIFFVIHTQILINDLRSVHGNYSEEVLAAIEEQFDVGLEYLLKSSNYDPADDTPFTTVTHHDLYLSNLMIKKGTF